MVGQPKASYDAEADAVYIALVDPIADGEVDRTIDLEASELGIPLLVDLDKAGRVIGIEVLQASRHLHLDR